LRWTCAEDESFVFPDPQALLAHEHVDIAPDIVDVFPERGFDECQCPLKGRTTMGVGCIVPQGQGQGLRQPSCVMRVTTPAVRREARAFFACDTLEGMELENQDTGSCGIVASHWEQRVFNGELLAPYGNAMTPRYISRVTLALFEDSGWYRPNYTMAGQFQLVGDPMPLIQGLHWGYGQGCGFALEKCVSEGQTDYPDHFCSTAGEYRCSSDRQNVMECPALASMVGWPGGTQFKYFTDDRIDPNSVLDYCPAPSVVITNRMCGDSSSEPYPATNANYMREVFNADSRCLMSDFRADLSKADGRYQVSNIQSWAQAPGCYETECYSGGTSYKVRAAVLDPSTGATTGTGDIGVCESAGQTLTHASYTGTVTCADPAVVCLGRQSSDSMTDVTLTGPELMNADGTTSGGGTGGGGGTNGGGGSSNQESGALDSSCRQMATSATPIAFATAFSLIGSA